MSPVIIARKVIKLAIAIYTTHSSLQVIRVDAAIQFNNSIHLTSTAAFPLSIDDFNRIDTSAKSFLGVTNGMYSLTPFYYSPADKSPGIKRSSNKISYIRRISQSLGPCLRGNDMLTRHLEESHQTRRRNPVQ